RDTASTRHQQFCKLLFRNGPADSGSGRARYVWQQTFRARPLVRLLALALGQMPPSFVQHLPHRVGIPQISQIPGSTRHNVVKQEGLDDTACFKRLFSRDDVDMVGIPAEVLRQSQPDRCLQRRQCVDFADEEVLRQTYECALSGQTVGEDEAEVRFFEIIAFGTPRTMVGALIAVGRAVELSAVVADDESRVDDRFTTGEDLLTLSAGSEVRR